MQLRLRDILYVNESGADATYTVATNEELTAVGFSSGQFTADFSGAGTSDLLNISYNGTDTWTASYTAQAGSPVIAIGASIEEAVAFIGRG